MYNIALKWHSNSQGELLTNLIAQIINLMFWRIQMLEGYIATSMC